MKLNVLRMYDDVKLPEYATDGSGCFDIYAYMIGGIEPYATIYGTGLKFEIPEGHVMLVFSRSGHGFKQNIRLANCVGVIDSDYRGELKVKLTDDNTLFDNLLPRVDERIAQAMIVPIPKVEFVEVAELSSTVRGENGIGSTN